MKCPNCHQNGSRVVDSRPADNGHAIRRRRECENCGFRFMRAAEKRPVAMDEIQNIVDQVETKIRAVGGNEVSSQLIGEYVMEILANVDDIAYIRFASVYREFKDMASFAKELQDLMARDNEKNK